MAPPSEIRRRQEEYIQDAVEAQRRRGVPPFKDAVEALKAFRDLFDSDEEMIEFADLLERQREEVRDAATDTVTRIVLDTDVVSRARAGRLAPMSARS